MAAVNDALASLIGRPDLAYRQQAQLGVVGNPPLAPRRADGRDSGLGGRGPAVALMVLVSLVVGFAVWVHPHLA